MALFQDTGNDPRAAAVQLADVLAFYGALGDAACGNPTGFAARKAATAAALAQVAQLDDVTRDAVYFAGMLHAIGAIGNRAYRKGDAPSERAARTERWDVPAQGARVCSDITALPQATADLVRWQAECWDGTGYPDQLRWGGIPLGAQLLGVADTFLRASDPDEALGVVGMQAGRAFGPEAARACTMWFHLTGGEEATFDIPLGELHPKEGCIERVLDEIASRVDAHNGVPGRWQRVARLADATAASLGFDDGERRALGLASRLYGCGEIASQRAENAEFDPLSRLANDERARHAKAAAKLIEPYAALSAAAPIVRSRSEWFDGTGKPRGLRSDAIPAASAVLATAIAYDALEHTQTRTPHRRSASSPLDGAAGTQFAPPIVRALLEAAGALA